jgi:polyhydroxybutyrate depolymerase
MKLPLTALALFLFGGCSSSGVAPATDAGVADAPAVTADTPAATDARAAVDAPAAPVDAGSSADAPTAGSPLIAARPYRLVVPDGIQSTVPAPLLILLHGYGASGMLQELYFRMTREANTRGILYAIPDGTLDASMRRFWNATDACCDFAHTNVDDVAYLDAIIDDASARYAVDPRRIFLIGHSNGAFMAHRMACARANRIAAIVSLAGATFADSSRCAPSEPVAVLQVHGTADTTILYNGGSNAGVAYPSAATSVARWGTHDRCAPTTTSGTTFDLDNGIPGAETRISRYEGCMGGAVELWSIEGGAHLPALNAQWSTLTLDWLMAHPKPAR